MLHGWSGLSIIRKGEMILTGGANDGDIEEVADDE